MVKIQSITTMIIDLPTIRPHVLAMTTMHQQSIVLVQIGFSDGIVGIGESTTIGGASYGPESPETVAITIENYIAPLLINEAASNTAFLLEKINHCVSGNHFAKCAVETALLDAMAQRAGVPLSELLGGRKRHELEVAWTLASGDTDKDIAEAEDMLAKKRHRIFKLKIGKRALQDDVAHVATIKKALGGKASIRVDVNQAWSEATAIRGIVMLEDAGCDLIEQPIAARFYDALARLTARSNIPIMADEALYGAQTAMQIAKIAGANVFSVKIQQAGGLYEGAKISAIAEAAGIALYGGTMLEGAVATIASAHLFSTFTTLEYQTELFGPLLLVDDILETPLTYENFCLQVPSTPGLGIALDYEKIAHYRRGAAKKTFHLVS